MVVIILCTWKPGNYFLQCCVVDLDFTLKLRVHRCSSCVRCVHCTLYMYIVHSVYNILVVLDV
jgi:hypothetical protein